MLIYWLLLGIPLSLLVIQKDRDISLFLWVIIFIIFVVFIGLREEVGMDWSNYQRMFESDSRAHFSDLIVGFEPAYHVLGWASSKLGGRIYLVNTVCAMLFMYGAISFSRVQPIPVLAFLLLLPYVVFVIVNDIVRQSVALGFILLALSYVKKDKGLLVSFWPVIVAFLFHKTALIMIPLFLYARKEFQSPMVKIFLIMVSVPLIIFLTTGSYFEGKWDRYVTHNLVSTGGPIRVAMNFIPAVIFLGMRHRFKKLWPDEYVIYSLFSYMAIITMGVVWFSTTGADRLTYYIIPLQIFVFGRLIYFFDDVLTRTTVVMTMITYYLLVWVVFSNFASNASAFIPYENILLIWLRN